MKTERFSDQQLGVMRAWVEMTKHLFVLVPSQREFLIGKVKVVEDEIDCEMRLRAEEKGLVGSGAFEDAAQADRNENPPT